MPDAAPPAGRISSWTFDPGRCPTADGAAQPDGLDGRNRHDGLREPAVQLAIPVHVAAEARRHAVRDDLEGAADGVAGLLRFVDHLAHGGRDSRIHTPHIIVRGERPGLFEAHGERIGERGAANFNHVTRHVDAVARQELAGDGAGGDSRGGLARAGALEYVAQVLARRTSGRRPDPRDPAAAA